MTFRPTNSAWPAQFINQNSNELLPRPRRQRRRDKADRGLPNDQELRQFIEDLNLDEGWLYVRNKAALGWTIKTGVERTIPLIAEVVGIPRRVIGARAAGVVFRRQRFVNSAAPALLGHRRELEHICDARQRAAGDSLSRAEAFRIARTVWQEAGAVKSDAIRTSFIRTMPAIGHAEATCPKSWRHTFESSLQDANVDLLVRQITLGHKPTTGTGPGMTTNYDLTRPETQRLQIEQALRRWPCSLELAVRFTNGDIA